MSDYERIARMIRYLDEHHAEQPDLVALAVHLDLSPSHFHRLFSSWAGVTPKDFLQCLTLTHVKELLREGQSVFDAALSVGLSGPGRLHDLCVSLEAASPGEVKSGGEGWKIIFGFAATPFGECIVAEGRRGICHLSFVDGNDRQKPLAELSKTWPKADLLRDDAAARDLAGKIFRPSAAPGEGTRLRAFVKGTDFQLRVWRALLRIPEGALVTYGRLAAAIGEPSAARAVGTAVGHNAISYLIPCHRVIRETGLIGGYRWGHLRKRAIVAWESARRKRPED